MKKPMMKRPFKLNDQVICLRRDGKWAPGRVEGFQAYCVITAVDGDSTHARVGEEIEICCDQRAYAGTVSAGILGSGEKYIGKIIKNWHSPCRLYVQCDDETHPEKTPQEIVRHFDEPNDVLKEMVQV